MSEIKSTQSCCLYCERTNEEAPLIALHYRGEPLWICAQHLPILIHQPHKLADKLPGAETLDASEEHHH